ncbi:Na/Pi cotransporter family protein [Brucepastera parasyntrophica]|uniref:Na/Pi cotransporter family protein n=1 Tax=Brucepastera parasyntrophica TaxID=2880008 RepID=UPI00210E8A8A|nr:Na/Pi cotransporter family protein [Brucepastera parasyntrophica]ULQ58767.1 Na/Pi cotransporter family protein [Brucepastera parasyntrophica]
MAVVSIIFQIIGSLGFLLYGMKLMSDGIQKTAGERLHKVLGFMTKNRFLAVLTGLFITMIIQSSSATTVMVVSFVNAGLLTLTQAIGVIFGANIGTTFTAWIVSLIGFSFNLSAFAVPAFGIGFLLTFVKKWKKQGLGEAIMGFGLLFVGLDMLSNALPPVTAENVAFLQFFADKGYLSVIIGILAGTIVTAIINSSSAVTAIIITLAYRGLFTWEFSAAMVLGSNIGTTLDAVLASIGTKVNARRAALVHVLFNTVGTIIAAIFFYPFLSFVDFLVPGAPEETITIHIAMLHTVFNVLCTLLFLPFTNQLARLTEFIIKPKADETPEVYRLEFISVSNRENAEGYIMQAEKELADMTDIAAKMVDYLADSLSDSKEHPISSYITKLAELEDYADQMKEGLSNYLVSTSKLPLSDKSQKNVLLMLQIVEELESMTDDCYSVALLLNKSAEKKMDFQEDDIERLIPYISLVQKFLVFIKEHINKHLTSDELLTAQTLENAIDRFRKNLKKVARKRLEDGADVKSELLYIDVVRNIEKIGDHAFSIAEMLAQTK